MLNIYEQYFITDKAERLTDAHQHNHPRSKTVFYIFVSPLMKGLSYEKKKVKNYFFILQGVLNFYV